MPALAEFRGFEIRSGRFYEQIILWLCGRTEASVVDATGRFSSMRLDTLSTGSMFDAART